MDSSPGQHGATVDLSTCEREPIHIPGSIQPHGLLLAVREADGVVVAASANTVPSLAARRDELLDRPLEGALDERSCAVIREAGCTGEKLPAGGLPVASRRSGEAFGVAHLHRLPGEGLMLVEIEKDAPTDDNALFANLTVATRHIQAAGDERAACAAAAAEIQRLTGFDRVKVYKFAADWSGEVIAEHRSGPRVRSYLGLHFPAGDIPPQARALYARNPIRLIPDSRYVPVPLEPAANPATGNPIDLSDVGLRSVSPIHVEYLRNMGVNASMSVSILHGDRTLWGLVACHHYDGPRLIGAETRNACELLVQVLAWQIRRFDEGEEVRARLRVKHIQTELLQAAEPTPEGAAGDLGQFGEGLLGVLRATGLALVSPEKTLRFGQTPGTVDLAAIVDWMTGKPSSFDIYATDALGAEFPSAEKCRDVASGLLAVQVARRPGHLMVWFRPELVRTVTWAGDPTKPANWGPNGDRLHPRQSFAAWSEEMRGRSEPWATAELTAAREVRDLVVDVLLRRAEAIDALNARLARSNAELESFAHVASHDLKEPLWQIQAFAGLLRPHISATGDRDLAHMAEAVGASAARLQKLVDDLAKFARIGSEPRPLVDIELGAILDEVEFDLGSVLREADAELNIPGINGFEALRHIRSHEKLKKLPVVVLSTADTAATVDRAYRLGANSYLVKVMDFDAFVGQMRQFAAFWFEAARLPTPVR